MTREVQKPQSPAPEDSATLPRRSALLAALSLLSASIGLVPSNSARGDDLTENRAKGSDKAAAQTDKILRANKGKPKPSGPSSGSTATPTPSTGGTKE